MIHQAQSGHPGVVSGLAPAIYVLFTKHLLISRKHPNWINRDRLVFSCGHASALLYSILYLTKNGFSVEDLKNFRQINSCTPGHPEKNIFQGIECTTGPLGQGVANGVGLAWASNYWQKHALLKKYIVNHWVYLICSDGDLQEGISYEAMNFAGVHKLKKLIVLYDSNNIQLDGSTKKVWVENIKLRFQAAQWNYILVTNGNDTRQINDAIITAKNNLQPTIIEIKTIIGEGLPQAGTALVHGTPPSQSDLQIAGNFFNFSIKEVKNFYISPKIIQHFQKLVINRGERAYQQWVRITHAHPINDAHLVAGNNLLKKINIPKITTAQSTRESSLIILQQIYQKSIWWVGGAADLASSCKTPWVRNQQIIWYGVREHAMIGINNGIALHSQFIPFAATFLAFSDYAKPAIRMAAMMKLNTLFIFSHDSLLVGEDGPTHQPIEQLIMLRAIPNVTVLRPADFNEVWGCYQLIIKKIITGPVCLVLSRAPVPQLNNSRSNITSGAYVIYRSCPQNKHQIIIFATGSEVALAIKIAQILVKNYQLTTKVISLVSWKLFLKWEDRAKKKIYDNYQSYTVSLELSSTWGWKKIAQLNIGVDHFGFSGKSNDIIKKIKWTPQHLSKLIAQKVMS